MQGSDQSAVNLNAVSVATINTTGGAVGAGSITLEAATLPTNITVNVAASGLVTNLNQITGYSGAGTPRNILVTGNLIANGAPISLFAGNGTANGNIFISGQVNDNATAGNAGSVTILQNCANPFVIGSGATVNGIAGVAGANALLVSPGAAGIGGTISITNNGAGGITVNDMTSSGNIQAAATSGKGASYTFADSTGPVVFNGLAGESLNANAAGAASAAGGFHIHSTRTFSAVGVPTFTANGVVGGNGGLVSISSSTAANAITVANAAMVS